MAFSTRFSASLLAVVCLGGCATVQSRVEPSMKARAEEWVVEEVVYKSTPQGELALYVRKPLDWRATDRRPAIVFFFGGGWTNGSPGQFAPQAAYLAERGMVTFCADYRVKNRHDVTPNFCVQDAKSAMRYVRSHAAEFGVDPERIVVSGGSAGGHLALCCALIEGCDDANDDLSVSALPAAVVAFNPVADVVGHERAASRMPDAAMAEALSPRHHLREGVAPMLILMGTQDFLYDGTLDFVAELGRLDNHVELYLAEGQPHGFFNKSPWLERTTVRMGEFLKSLGYIETP